LGEGIDIAKRKKRRDFRGFIHDLAELDVTQAREITKIVFITII
jgi:hypothetical protein